jgi:hypothetical protein
VAARPWSKSVLKYTSVVMSESKRACKRPGMAAVQSDHANAARCHLLFTCGVALAAEMG